MVVVAAGIGPFANRPPEFANLPSTLASHSSEHSDFSEFSQVVVIGVRQSAFESAAPLVESGATVEILVRER
jgi:FAD-dependent urate hydroxylase